MKKLREFKLCKKCNKELSYTKFRERKDTGWTDINNKLRYTYCRECEKKNLKKHTKETQFLKCCLIVKSEQKLKI